MYLATQLEEVYNLFLGEIEDDEILLVTQETLENMLHGFLLKSIVDFKVCKKGLDIDYATMSFKEDLTIEEQVILAKGMVLHYLNPRIMREELMEVSITSKDFKSFANSGQLKAMIELREVTKRDLKEYISAYDYSEFKGFN